MKGHMYGGGVGNSKGRQLYGIMLILAFGAAVMGVMLLHKVRERRIFTMLVEEKDRQLISLHLLLQKERDHYKEAKRKMEEMKTKIYSVRAQKTDLDSLISEMKSTISSLKEEQRTLETALDEKQNEINHFRAKESELHTQENTLTENPKQKEPEIKEEPKHLLTKIWSVSTDDPSNLTFNSTNNLQHQTQRDELGNETSDDKVEVKVNPSFNETAVDPEAIATKGEIDNSSNMEKESAYANQRKDKRSRLRARRGGRVFRSMRYGQQIGKYKKIVDKELQKLGMYQGDGETASRYMNLKDDISRDNKIYLSNERVEEMQRNGTVDMSSNASSGSKSIKETGEEEKNINGVEVRLETSNDETIDQSTQEKETNGEKNDEVEAGEIKDTEEDDGQSKAEQGEDKESNKETDDLDF